MPPQVAASPHPEVVPLASSTLTIQPQRPTAPRQTTSMHSSTNYTVNARKRRPLPPLMQPSLPQETRLPTVPQSTMQHRAIRRNLFHGMIPMGEPTSTTLPWKKITYHPMKTAPLPPPSSAVCQSTYAADYSNSTVPRGQQTPAPSNKTEIGLFTPTPLRLLP